MDNEPTRLERELDSTLDPGVDLDELRDGGPTRTPGVMTTTGGTAGPASTPKLRTRPEGIDSMTTGDHGSGGSRGTTASASDATTAERSGPAAAGNADQDRRSSGAQPRTEQER